AWAAVVASRRMPPRPSERRLGLSALPPPAGGATRFPRSREQLLQRHAAADRAGALMARLDPDLRASGSLDHPLELPEVGGRLLFRPPGRRTLLDAAFELAGRRLHLASHQPRAFRQLELDLELAHGLPLERFLRDVRRQPTGVLQHEPHEE